MRPLTKIEKYGLIALVLAAGSYVYFNHLYDPEMRRLKKASVSLLRVRKQISTLGEAPESARLERTVARQKNKLAELENRMRRMSQKVRNPAEAQKAITQIGLLAAEAGLSVDEQISKDKPATPNKQQSRRRRKKRRRVKSPKIKTAQKPKSPELDLFSWYGYELVLSGRFSAFVEFLEAIKKSGMIVVINELRITSGKASGRIEIKLGILL